MELGNVVLGMEVLESTLITIGWIALAVEARRPIAVAMAEVFIVSGAPMHL